MDRKRNATEDADDARAWSKRMRIGPPTHSVEHFSDEEAEDGDYQNEDESDSGHDPTHKADTPLTPFSPVSGRFPSDLKTIRCPFDGCTKTFNRPARLAGHLRSHNNERPFICSYDGCDKAYIEEKHLRQHIKGSHTHEKNYSCEFEGCGKSFMTATRLRRHEDAHRGHERFRCTGYVGCDETFRKHQTLQRHIRSEHMGLTPFPCTHIDPSSGAPCEAGFDSSGALRKHEDRMHGAPRYWCEDCSFDDSSQVGFITKAELTKHIKNEHLFCLFCDLKCCSENALQRHIDSRHQGPRESKKIACTEPNCTKFFSTKSNLTHHIRTYHNGERFVCGTSSIGNTPETASWDGHNACGKHFVSKVNLEDHVRTQHLGLRSLVNAKRIKSYQTKERGQRTKFEADNNQDAIDLLTGLTPQGHINSKSETRGDAAAIRFEQDYTEIVSSGNDNMRRENQRRKFGSETSPDPPFWMGADDDLYSQNGQSTWMLEEEAEMRRLIDLDDAVEHGSFREMVDPALL